MELQERLAQKIAAYHPASSVVELLRRAHILLLVAVSGGGKDTIKHRLLDTGHYHHIVSYTTRQPRVNNGAQEQDGADYHFIDEATAERMLDEGLFIETDLYADHMYGTGVADIEAAYNEGKIATTDITIEGAAEYLKLAPTVKVVFLLPPNYEVWMERLIRRYGGTQQGRDIHLRMQEAVGEIEQAMASDNMYIVINDNIDDTVHLINGIAEDQPVAPHHPKAMEVAQQILDRLEQEISQF